MAIVAPLSASMIAISSTPKFFTGEFEMTRHWLAGAAALAMMTGIAFAQGTSSASSTSAQSTAPAAESPGAAGATSTAPPAGVSPAPASPNITDYGTGGMQALPGTSPNNGTGTH
jgi:hypothetical protein